MGSVDQNSGSFMLTAARVGGGTGVAAPSVALTSPSTCMVGSSGAGSVGDVLAYN